MHVRTHYHIPRLIQEAQSQAGGAVDRLARVLILVRVTDDKAIKQRCTNEAFAELLRQPEWEQIIGSPDELFMTVYHAAYRRDTEWCICKEKLMVRETLRNCQCPQIAHPLLPPKLPSLSNLIFTGAKAFSVYSPVCQSKSGFYAVRQCLYRPPSRAAVFTEVFVRLHIKGSVRFVGSSIPHIQFLFLPDR